MHHDRLCIRQCCEFVLFITVGFYASFDSCSAQGTCLLCSICIIFVSHPHLHDNSENQNVNVYLFSGNKRCTFWMSFFPKIWFRSVCTAFAVLSRHWTEISSWSYGERNKCIILFIIWFRTRLKREWEAFRPSRQYGRF